MEQLCIEGIIVHAFPFKERDRIITVFAPDEGLVKIVVKGAFTQKQGQGSTTTPLTHIEANCTRGNSELYTCREFSVCNSNIKLRQNLATLEAACDMLQAIASTQQPGKAAPELYQLLKAYLAKLPVAAHPSIISTSFRLKTLRYEGLLEISHDLGIANSLTATQRQIVEILAFCREFDVLASLEGDTKLTMHVKDHFLRSIQK